MLKYVKRADYLGVLKRHLPPGLFYRNISRVGHPFEVLLHLASAELARIHNRLLDSIQEFFPSSATETIESWETMAGIPDDCVTQPETLEARRALVAARLHGVIDNASYEYENIARQFGASGCYIKRTWDHGLLPGHPVFSSPFAPITPEWGPFCWSFYVANCPSENRANLTCELRKIVPAGVSVMAVHYLDLEATITPSPFIPVLRF